MSSREAEDGTPSRAERAEAALREALAERNRLWEELGRRSAAERDAAYWRKRAEDIEASAWWRAGRPFRLAKIALREPASVLNVLAHKIWARENRR